VKIGTSSAAFTSGTRMLNSRMSPATKRLPEPCRLSMAPRTLRVSVASVCRVPKISMLASIVSTGRTSPGQRSPSETTDRSRARRLRECIGETYRPSQ
jgi:hypothetical protein